MGERRDPALHPDASSSASWRDERQRFVSVSMTKNHVQANRIKHHFTQPKCLQLICTCTVPLISHETSSIDESNLMSQDYTPPLFIPWILNLFIIHHHTI